MRKLLFLTLALLVLSGCGARVPEAPEPLPEEAEETFSLPETRQLEPLSAPGIVTEGRELAEVDSAALPEEDRAPSVGDTIQLEVFPEECRVRFWGGVDVRPTHYIADISAGVAYQDGIFTLSDFHLQLWLRSDFYEKRLYHHL